MGGGGETTRSRGVTRGIESKKERNERRGTVAGENRTVQKL